MDWRLFSYVGAAAGSRPIPAKSSSQQQAFVKDYLRFATDKKKLGFLSP